MMSKTTELANKFGMKVRLERIKRGLSQEKLAELANLSYTTISSIERSENSPTIETVRLISEVFEISMQEMFNFNY